MFILSGQIWTHWHLHPVKELWIQKKCEYFWKKWQKAPKIMDCDFLIIFSIIQSVFWSLHIKLKGQLLTYYTFWKCQNKGFSFCVLSCKIGHLVLLNVNQRKDFLVSGCQIYWDTMMWNWLQLIFSHFFIWCDFCKLCCFWDSVFSEVIQTVG